MELQRGYELHTWHTAQHVEVDFVLHGERSLHAIEVKRSANPRDRELRGLAAFGADYPQAKRWMLYGGRRRRHQDGIEMLPMPDGVPELLAAL